MSTIRLTWMIICVWLATSTTVQEAGSQETGAQDRAAGPLTIALTEKTIAVDAGFSGAKVTLFGVLNDRSNDGTAAQPLDIVAVIAGPRRDVRVRPIERNGPIWTAGTATIAQAVPSLYYVLSSAPLNGFLSNQQITDREFDPPSMNFDIADSSAASSLPTIMRDALIDARVRRGLFKSASGAVVLLGNGLFSVEIDLPAETPVGGYAVSVSAWRNGHLVDEDVALMIVGKAGLERQIYDFAHQQSFAYGVLCVLISLFAGWAVSLIFRRK